MCPEGYKRLYNLSISENWCRQLASHPLLKTLVIGIHPLVNQLHLSLGGSTVSKCLFKFIQDEIFGISVKLYRT